LAAARRHDEREAAALAVMEFEGDSFQLADASVLAWAAVCGMYRVVKAIVCHPKGLAAVVPTLEANLADPWSLQGNVNGANVGYEGVYERVAFDAYDPNRCRAVTCLKAMVGVLSARHDDPQLFSSFVDAFPDHFKSNPHSLNALGGYTSVQRPARWQDVFEDCMSAPYAQANAWRGKSGCL
jgi:hypothetical protein